MQNRSHANFLNRMLFYTASAIAGQGERGTTWQYDIKAVYSVAFLNFSMEELSGFRTDIVLAYKETGKVASDKLRMIFLQLPHFTKSLPEECENDFERWIFTLKHMEDMENLPYAAQNAAFQRLADISTLAGMTSAERRKYEAALKVYRDNLVIKAQEEIERQRYEERIRAAVAEGEERIRAAVAEGEERVRAAVAEGEERVRAALAEGLAEGERNRNREIALAMAADQMPIEVVAKYTGMTVEQIASWLTDQKGEA